MASDTARLRQRREPDELVPLHLGFAEWMRAHATDPSHVHEAVTLNGWDAMRWERWFDLPKGDPRWSMTVIDTSALTAEQVAVEAAGWCRR